MQATSGDDRRKKSRAEKISGDDQSDGLVENPSSETMKRLERCLIMVDVNGKNAAPLYKYLKSSKGGIFGDNIKWNFSKFLADKDGNVRERYAPTTSPMSIEKDIKKLLGVS